MAGYEIVIPSKLDAVRLFDWCIDFRDDDAETLERGQDVDTSFMLQRKVTRDGPRIKVEMLMRTGEGKTPVTVDIIAHRATTCYLADIRFSDVYRQICRYDFEPDGSGSRVRIVAEVEGNPAKGDVLSEKGGAFVDELRDGMRKMMTGFMRQAEKELLPDGATRS